jgi:predicted transporter
MIFFYHCELSKGNIMKHLKVLPFLIGAALYAQRSHAAEVVQTAEPSGLSMALICLGLIILSVAGHSRSNVIKPEH